MVIPGNGIGAKALTIALAAAVVLLILPYTAGLIGAAVLYVVAVPVVRRLDPTRRHKWPPLVAVFALFVILVIPGVLLLAELVAQIPDAAQSVQQSAAVQRLTSRSSPSLPVRSPGT
jgi:predicted PurR-regulated permease PerM